MISDNSTQILVINSSQQTVSADAIVEEQDTFLLLGASPVIQESEESYVTLVKKMERQKPLEPGHIIVKGTNPVRFIAVNYNIENNPVCCEGWIKTSLQNIFRECRKRKITSLLTPLPGTKYGKISKEFSMQLLTNALLDKQGNFPEKIFIIHES